MASLVRARSAACAAGLALAACLPSRFDDLTAPRIESCADAGPDGGRDASCGVPADAGCDGCSDSGEAAPEAGPCATCDAGVTPSCAAPECELGAAETVPAPCGACNTGTTMRTRSCDADGCWLPFVDGECTGVTAACTPQETKGCDNGDSCGHRVCNDACQWGPCEPMNPGGCLRIGPDQTEEGTHFRCCDYAPTPAGWQYCLPDCTWSLDCSSCNPCPCP
jgi:hypothetical protein